ncbi:MAG: antibiotic biosynthesis monooxygenase family protein [Nonlabens sp.]
MIVRIVKMHFAGQYVADFKVLFDQYKSSIRNQPGCTHLELYQDRSDAGLFYTYSHWQNEESLNNYRGSSLFSIVWPATKIMFDRKPEAHSLNTLHRLG